MVRCKKPKKQEKKQGQPPAWASAFACAGMLLLVPGCLFLPAREGLARLRVERGKPWAVTVFSATPAPVLARERPLSELRETLVYWSSPGARGEPRWKGVLEPEPEDLYSRLIAAIDAGASSVTLYAYRYDAAGLDDITLVDYVGERGERLGTDQVAFPDPPSGSPPRYEKGLVGYDSLAWWEYPQMLLDLPVYLVLGLKEVAGEAVKSPLSLVSSGWLGPAVEGRPPFSPVCFERAGLAFTEDWRNGFTAFGWRFRVRSRHTPLDLVRELAASVPLLGLLFERGSPPEDSAPPPATTIIAVSQGIHMGGDSEQYLTAWRRAVSEARPAAIAVVVPYRYGSFFDTLWSMLNISQGMGFDLAARLVFDEGVAEGDAVELVGFSGGAQRVVSASRALRAGGILVNRLVGVAGPVAGLSTGAESSLLIAEDPLGDPVVLSARVADFVLFPFPTNIRRQTVPGADGHRLPYLPDGATRKPALGYARSFEHLLKGP